ncbi:MAG TPA: hypothetical protein ENN17_01910, partial [bacterium]|nr:hypothetical protein [bacterium]
MKRLACIFLFSSAVGLTGAEKGVEVRPADDHWINTASKQIASAAFRIRNLTEVETEFEPELSLPTGWRPVVDELPFTMGPDASEVRIVSFQIPASAAAGQYTVTYRVASRRDPSVQDEFGIGVHVMAVRDFRVRLLNPPDHAFAGDTSAVQFMIENGSNVTDTLRIRFEINAKWTAWTDAETVVLRPGEHRIVTARIAVPVSVTRESRQTLRLSGFSPADPELPVLRQTHTLRIIPRDPVREDLHHRLPVDVGVKLLGNWENGRFAHDYQIDIHARGALDEAGKQKAAFRYRAPDMYDTSPLGQRDEIFARFENDRFLVFAGDGRYTLSTLTEKQRYGRGAEVGFTLNNWIGGGMAYRDRWTQDRSRVGAGYLGYRVTDTWLVKTHFMSKERRGRTAVLASIAASGQPFVNTTVELEAATGRREDEDSKNAYHAKIRGRTERFQYHAELIKTDNGFPGYYSTLDMGMAGLTWKLNDRVQFFIQSRQSSDYYLLLDGRYAEVRGRYTSAMIQYRMSRSASLRLGGINVSRTDRQPEPKFDYADHTGRFEMNAGFHDFSIHARTEMGRTQNRLTGLDALTQRYLLSLRYQPSSRASVNVNAGYDESRRVLDRRSTVVSLGLTADWQFTSVSKLTLRMQNATSPDQIYTDRDMFDLTLTHRFPNRHWIELRARHTLLRGTEDTRDAALLAEYHVPVGVPIRRKANIGSLSGRVIDAETGMPAENIWLRINGATAVTNKEGIFRFSALTAKTYYLSLDRSNIGLNRIATQKMPMQIDIAGGVEQQIHLSLVQAARLSGRIVVYRVVNDSSDHFSASRMDQHLDAYYVSGSGNGANGNGNGKNGTAAVTNGKVKLVEDYGLSNTLVTLSRDDEEFRLLTGPDGAFVFDGLRPGTWLIRFGESTLPEYHQYKQKEFLVTLEAGEIRDLNAEVMP